MASFDVAAVLRRIRRTADLSQRELAARCGVAGSVIAHAEAGRRSLALEVLITAAELAGLRLALLDETGTEVHGMADEAVRDFGRRRFPAHLDTRHGDERWWHGPERYSRGQPWYTFDRDRGRRDAYRDVRGTPEDQQLPHAGDSPADRRAARQRTARQRQREDVERRRAAGALPRAEPFTCTCPAACDELDDWAGRPVHADECRCGCDVG